MKFLSTSIFTVFILLSVFKINAQSAVVNVDEFATSIASPNAQLLDVRTAGEYQAGHLANALQADWNNQEQFAERAKTLDKSKPVYTYCLSGVRSKAAAEWLAANGYKAYTLSGGINAWKNAGKPVEGKKDVPQISSKDYFSKIPANKTVLVDFSAVWCPPCKKMVLVLDSLKQTDSKRFVLVTIDGGEQTSISKEMKVENFPTLILYKNGKEAWRKTGLITLAELRSLL
ncbi:MAG: thioredoxin domain-containing protein [Chitinophagaceae bacterium]